MLIRYQASSGIVYWDGGKVGRGQSRPSVQDLELVSFSRVSQEPVGAAWALQGEKPVNLLPLG